MAEERTPTPVNLVATPAFDGFGTQVVKPTEDASMEDTTGEEEAQVLSEHEVSGVLTSDDSMNDSRQDGFQGPLTQVATQNNALFKKLLQDDTKKQDSDTKKEDDSRLDGYDGPLTQQN